MAILENSDQATNQWLGDQTGGASISKDGSVVAFGTRLGGNNYGKVYIWKERDGGWTSGIQTETASVVGPASFSQFGWNVELNREGDKLIVGAHDNRTPENTSTGVICFSMISILLSVFFRRRSLPLSRGPLRSWKTGGVVLRLVAMDALSLSVTRAQVVIRVPRTCTSARSLGLRGLRPGSSSARLRVRPGIPGPFGRLRVYIWRRGHNRACSHRQWVEPWRNRAVPLR